MTICQFCGTKLMDGAKFCYKCERKLEYPGNGPQAEAERSEGMKDNVINRSNVIEGGIRIGEDRKYCPGCNTPISEKNRGIKCDECQAPFCAACEGDFRPERQKGEKPYCKKHYEKNRERLKAEQARKQESERLKAEEEKRMDKEQEAFINSIGQKFKLIPAGEFMMGDKQWDDSNNMHKVRITKSFYLGVYQVTQKEWGAVMGSNPSNFKGDDLPVENVSWDDCQEFIERLNKKEGTYAYRLPTEAEWEYACRAGSAVKFCFGDDESKLGRYAWYGSNSVKKTHSVGTKAPNTWGLYDMHGNVWEWCEDWYDTNYYKESPKDDPQGPSNGSYRVFRGGSWNYEAANCASGNRRRNGPGRRSDNLGLRLARSV